MWYFLVFLFPLTDRVAGSHSVPSRVCTTWSQTNCVGGDDALLTTEVRLSYSFMFDQSCPGQVGPVFLRKGEEWMYNLSYPERRDNQTAIERVEYYFEQQEHGGGGCNCVEIDINCEEEHRLVSMSPVLFILQGRLTCSKPYFKHF